MTVCQYDQGWGGKCTQPAGINGFCGKHEGMRCVNCKSQATNECCHTGQFVCGAPLCDNCEGAVDTTKPAGTWGFMNHTHKRKASPSDERDMDARPYTPDEVRVAKFFFEAGIGGGNDPIGGLIAAHRFAMEELNRLREIAGDKADPQHEVDERMLRAALRNSDVSTDPDTRVGAVILMEDGQTAGGHNSFPPGVAETPERMASRETKLAMIVHAEMDAVAQANSRGISLKGATLYLAATDATGDVWGGPPCTNCTKHLIAFGIKRVVSRPVRKRPSKWHADLKMAGEMLAEAGVEYVEIP